VLFVREAITPQQLTSYRQSYVNTVLIQQASVLIPRACSECQQQGLRPFPECRVTVEHFENACGNCKWRDHGAFCIVQHMPVRDKSDSDKESDNSQESDDKPALIKDDRRQQRLLGPVGGANNPIII
jgi:hypothetical protein